MESCPKARKSGKKKKKDVFRFLFAGGRDDTIGAHPDVPSRWLHTAGSRSCLESKRRWYLDSFPSPHMGQFLSKESNDRAA